MLLFKHAKISRAEASDEIAFRSFRKTARNRHSITPTDLAWIDHWSSSRIVNHYARRRWWEALCDKLEKELGYSKNRTTNQPIYFVTLVHIDFVSGHDELGYDVGAAAKHYSDGLKGFDFLGLIEPALYSHITMPRKELGKSKCVFWHLHALVWNCSPKAIKRRIKRLNQSGDFVPITDNQYGSHSAKIKRRTLCKVVGYMCKPPNCVYRIGRVQKPDGSFRKRQYRDRNIRPGERVTLFQQMKHLRFGDVLVAGGRGKRVLADVRNAIHDQKYEKNQNE